MTPSPTPLALVTGSSRGLGRSMAIHLARRGADVIVTYQGNAEAAAEVVEAIHAEGRKAVALRLDTGAVAGFPAFKVSVIEAMAAMGHDKLDYLVNNAGFGVHATFEDTTEAQFDALVNVHVKGVFFLTQALLPLIADGGRIVMLSSGLTRLTLPWYPAYGMMKGAVEQLTRYLAKVLGARRITVNTVAPGAIETDFAGGVVRDNAQMNAQIASITAMGRVGLPDDIGAAVADLLTGQFGWVTGQRIEVSGGQGI
ncbi:SDR family oxidoreductase [Frigidibacter sp. MR17.14]|uniref:SDR family NAD(P)-dependent oxidoreductase n=1 Tax=Frigidibacter sp. MR17.14 TaxID=3126509 RepID=UPI0030130A02